MQNKDVFKEFGTEEWVIEENLCYLLQEYKELVRQNKWQGVNLVGFVKDFMKQETFVHIDLAEKSKMETLEDNVIDVIDVEYE